MSEVVKITPQETIIAERLRSQWRVLVQSVGGNPHLVDTEFAKMIREYQSGDGRSYHGLSHIGKTDEMLNRYSHLSRNFVALKFAGDGHDVIYVPGSETNEKDSANFMEGIMTRLEMPDPTIAETGRIILLTKEHKTTDDDIDGKIMIDTDFAIFASSEAEYDAYAQGIWQEYVGSEKVTEKAFREVRGNLIEGWLKQDKLFLTDEIREKLQSLARQNLQRELLRLAS